MHLSVLFYIDSFLSTQVVVYNEKFAKFHNCLLQDQTSIMLTLFLHVVLQLVVVILTTSAVVRDQTIRIDPSSKTFIDSISRTRIFHGVNAVFKIAPWHPDTKGFDSNNTLSIDDAKLLRSYGFNIVRLGVMWPGMEPGNEGSYNETYLDACEEIVDNLASEGIYVILDLHQDLWHRKYCGEGVPDYVQSKCSKSFENKRKKSFPAPVAKADSYPIDEEGNPALDSCLSKFFASYYMTEEVSSAFQCLYDNEGSLWSSLGKVWQKIASRFKTKTSVLGYELINEPWMGDIYKHPSLLVPGNTEKDYLQPMYQFLNTMIREVDDQKIIFFEGLTIDYWPSGFNQAPGDSSYNDRQSLAYHIYCLPDPNKAEALLCSGANDEFFQMRKKDSERLGVATIMTEFGATMALKGALHDLDSLAKQSDKHQQSWMYWQYKYFHDITTSTPVGESLFNNDGTPAVEKLSILTRPYPSAIAGSLSSYSFDTKEGLKLSYSLLKKLPSNQEAATSVINMNKAMHFPQGLSISVTGSGAANTIVRCVDNSSIEIVQTAGVDGEGAVDVTISSSCSDSGCTC